MSVWENLGYEFVRNTMVGLMQRGCVGSERELKTGAGTEHQLWKLDATVFITISMHNARPSWLLAAPSIVITPCLGSL